MKRTLKSIEPLKLALMLGAFHALFSLIFIVPFVLFFAVIAGAMPNTPSAPSGPMIIVWGLVAAVLTPVFYGAIGFLFGLVGAFFYNIIASWIGGVEVEVE